MTYKKRLSALLLFVLIAQCAFMRTVSAVTPFSGPLGTAIGAIGSPEKLPQGVERAVVMDLISRGLLYDCQGGEAFHPVGGAVALMTALVAAENAKADDIVPVGELTGAQVTRAVGLKKGMEAAVEDLLAAMLLYGAQDAAVALAEHITDTQASFVQMMNDMAASLGMLDTRYANATGAYDAYQVTTARDTSLLLYALVQSPEIMELLALPQYHFATRGGELQKTLDNRSQLVNPESDAYDPRVLGALVGSTDTSGFNALIIARDQDREVLALICMAHPAAGYEGAVRAVLDEAFTQFLPFDIDGVVAGLSQSLAILSGGLEIPVTARVVQDSGGVMIHQSADRPAVSDFSLAVSDIVLPERYVKGDVLAGATLEYQSRQIARVSIIAQEDSRVIAGEDEKTDEDAAAGPEDIGAMRTAQTASEAKRNPEALTDSQLRAMNDRSFYDRYGAFIWSAAACVAAALAGYILKPRHKRV